MPHLHRDWAHRPCHICAGTGLTPCHICAATGLIPCHICAGTGLTPCHICRYLWGDKVPTYETLAGMEHMEQIVAHAGTSWSQLLDEPAYTRGFELLGDTEFNHVVGKISAEIIRPSAALARKMQVCGFGPNALST